MVFYGKNRISFGSATKRTCSAILGLGFEVMVKSYGLGSFGGRGVGG